MLKKSSLIFFIFFLLLAGCTEPLGGDYFFKKIQSLEEAIKKDDWKSAESQVEDIKKLYKENDWKLQLLGDESEYEGMHESLSRIKAAVKNKDSKQALIELATIKAYVEQIYSL